VLFLAAGFQFCSYYADQTPAPVQKEILQHYSASNIQYNLFYALDGILNIFLCFSAGTLLSDRMLGIRKSIILFTSMIGIGQLLMLISAYYASIQIAILGRCFSGIGTECQNVTFYALIALWFTQKEHGMASAVSAMSMRLGMVASGIVTPLVQHTFQTLTMPFTVALSFCIVGLFCAVSVVVVDHKNESAFKAHLRRLDTLSQQYANRHNNE
jgi:nitrate/nitrite transporter NarK